MTEIKQRKLVQWARWTVCPSRRPYRQVVREKRHNSPFLERYRPSCRCWRMGGSDRTSSQRQESWFGLSPHRAENHSDDHAIRDASELQRRARQTGLHGRFRQDLSIRGDPVALKEVAAAARSDPAVLADLRYQYSFAASAVLNIGGVRNSLQDALVALDAAPKSMGKDVQ
ncbi:MAG: hypothetical protein WB784_11410 [Rhodanobacteraceae bacterium]